MDYYVLNLYSDLSVLPFSFERKSDIIKLYLP